MARPKAFDTDQALDAAIGVFREHGFEGTSAQMLVHAMGVGRQSLYDTFGDKWRLYREAVRRYSEQETSGYLAAMRTGPRAWAGLEAMINRVVAIALDPCLGVTSICEFGRTRPDLSEIHDRAGGLLNAAIEAQIREAQAEGDVAPELDPADAAAFLTASIASLRIAARGGASGEQLSRLAALTMRSLR